MDLATASKLMPLMPDEVFNIWLAPLIHDDGWPFATVHSVTDGTVWHRYFDGHSVKTISELRWKRQKFPAFSALLEPRSSQRLQWIIDAHMMGVQTPCANLKNGGGKTSFLRSRSFIARTGQVHTPVVLIQGMGLQIMDGNHRLAAAFSIPNFFALLDCWIGHRPKDAAFQSSSHQ